MGLQHRVKCNIAPLLTLPQDVLHMFRPPSPTKEAYLAGAVLDPSAEVLSFDFTIGVIRIECFLLAPDEPSTRKRGTEEVPGFVRVGFTFSPPAGAKATAVRAKVVSNDNADMLVYAITAFAPFSVKVLANVPREGEPHSLAYIKVDLAADTSWPVDAKGGEAVQRKAG